jgi:hypothetical protein
MLDKAKRKVDLAFLIDATSSVAMRHVISMLPDKIEKLVLGGTDFWDRKIDWRFRTIGYRDRDVDGNSWLVDNPFVTHVEHCKAQIATLECVGGGDEPESLLDAMYVVSQWPMAEKDTVPSWGEWHHHRDAARVMVVITDASCKPTFTAADGSKGEIPDIINACTASKLKVLLFAPDAPCYYDLGMMNGLEWEVTGPLGEATAGAAGCEAFDRALEGLSRATFSGLIRARMEREIEFETMCLPSDLGVPPTPPPTPEEILAEAEQHLVIQEKMHGTEDPLTANALERLANLYKAKGDYAAAEPLYRRVLAIQESFEGPMHQFTAISLADLASVLTRMAAYEEAETLYRRAIGIYEHIMGPDDFNTNATIDDLAMCLADKGDNKGAAEWYRRLLASRDQTLGVDDPKSRETRVHLALLYVKMGHPEDASELRRLLPSEIRT